MTKTILLTVLSVFVLLADSYCQKSDAMLIDQFGRLACDNVNGRIWNLVFQVEKLPGSRALIFVHPPSVKPENAKAQLRFFLAQFEFEGLEDRVEIKIGHEMDGLLFELWIIPEGATPPNLSGDAWLPPRPDITIPFIFGYEDEIGECPTFVPRTFAELLIANPGSRAHIVIKVGSYESAQAKGFADDTIKTLVEKFKVQGQRIRTFYIRQKEKNSLTYAEYWFVPAKITGRAKK